MILMKNLREPTDDDYNDDDPTLPPNRSDRCGDADARWMLTHGPRSGRIDDECRSMGHDSTVQEKKTKEATRTCT